MRTAELPEGWEEWLAFLAAQLPWPVERQESEDGTVLFTAGDPGEVIVRLTHTTIHVGEFTVPRRLPSTPEVVPRWLGRVHWRRMPMTNAVAVTEALISTAREVRRARYRTCRSCERLLPPEGMSDETTCERCAVQEPGVVS